MTRAAMDYVLGHSPAINSALCTDQKIGYDRVWRVGATLLDFANPETQQAWPSRATLAELCEMSEREVGRSLRVLEQSGVISRVGRSRAGTVVWAPSWRVKSRKRLDGSVQEIVVESGPCKQARVGRDRAWRVAVLHRFVSSSAKKIASLVNFSLRVVRQAMRAADRRPLRLRVRKAIDRTITFTKEAAVDWDLFGTEDRVPDEGTMPTRSAPKRHMGRKSKPVVEWTPLDSAKEFRDRVVLRRLGAPNDTGNVITLSKILGKMRKQHGYDARVEMAILDLFLSDEERILSAGRNVPVWKKWLASFRDLYFEADEYLARTDSSYQSHADKFWVGPQSQDQAMGAAAQPRPNKLKALLAREG